jgi:hypothetical protein
MSGEGIIANDVARRTAAVSDIEKGLRGEDAWFWRGQAQKRVLALEKDGAQFGLLPHEETELATLKALLG